MLNFYLCTVEVYHNNKFVSEIECSQLLTDEKPQNKEYNVTWDNIIDVVKELSLIGNYDIRQRKKGMKISFYKGGDIWYHIKQWKNPELNVTIKVSYTKINKSVSRVLEWSDGEKALRYLVERGLTVIRERND